MQCKNCGKELKDDAKFCDQCGTKVTEADSPRSKCRRTVRAQRLPKQR